LRRRKPERCARDEGVSQSAISQHIRRLEQELGQPLFERGRRGCSLPPPDASCWPRPETAWAPSMAPNATSIVSSQARLVPSESPPGHHPAHFMIRPLAAFRRGIAAITFDYVSASSTTQCLDALRRTTADLAYVTIGVDDSLELVPPSDQWVLVVAADDPLARQAQLRVRGLADYAPSPCHRIPPRGTAGTAARRPRDPAQGSGDGRRLGYRPPLCRTLASVTQSCRRFGSMT